MSGTSICLRHFFFVMSHVDDKASQRILSRKSNPSGKVPKVSPSKSTSQDVCCNFEGQPWSVVP